MSQGRSAAQTRCPKCGWLQTAATECRQCGLLFAKYRPSSGPGLGFVAEERALGRSSRGLRFSGLWKWLLVMWILLLCVSFFKKNQLPDPSQVLQPLYQAPRQTPIAKAPFQVQAGDQSYTITPRYGYELHGLVVSFHHSGDWWDIYHDAWQDFINIKDLCVVWGQNIATSVYSHMEFSSGSWTCWYRWKDRETGALFDAAALSNNHLLANHPDINRRIMKASIGDQVYFKGYLAEYANDGTDFQRGTSTSRDDRGNGACETVYIEDFRILKRANPLWKWIYRYGWWAAGACLLLWAGFALREPYLGK